MKTDSKTKFWNTVICLTALTLIFITASAATAQSDYAVLLQQTPADGGTVSPGTGVHSVNPGSITLTATPKAGYQFLYWLGAVSDPTASTTELAVNGPKLVIAVFERVEYEFISTEAGQRISQGPEARYPSAQSIGGGGGGGGGGRRSSGGGSSSDFFEEPDEEPNTPDDPFPTPPEVPEPATVILLAAGAMLLRAKRTSR